MGGCVNSSDDKYPCSHAKRALVDLIGCLSSVSLTLGDRRCIVGLDRMEKVRILLEARLILHSSRY
jgi:hypothetical protein